MTTNVNEPRREKTGLRSFRPGQTQIGLYIYMQSQKQARGWKFWIQEDVLLYYLCSENKGADPLCSYFIFT